jgi:hypothetical protein
MVYPYGKVIVNISCRNKLFIIETDEDEITFSFLGGKVQINEMQRTIQRLADHVATLEHKISLLYKTAFSIEQDCRRKHQEIQELIAQKDGIERLIANLLNGEGYSKLNQIVKENVKAVLSDNKIQYSYIKKGY